MARQRRGFAAVGLDDTDRTGLPWALEEDQRLERWVKTHGEDFSGLGTVLNRSKEQIRRRWARLQSRGNRKMAYIKRWAPHEDSLLIEYYKNIHLASMAAFIGGESCWPSTVLMCLAGCWTADRCTRSKIVAKH
eukprot:GABV01002580.1.p1 GENE.GABV01002580.1~~GABV01002580.1.p1  ORF type:complete len:134 (+),score=20.90 GABV01002580.1:197-598(+)